MPARCLAGGCFAFPDVEKGIILHAIPFYNDDRPEARKRKKKWVDFVKQKRSMGADQKLFLQTLPLPTRRVISPSPQDLKEMNWALMFSQLLMPNW